jgi:hypothetical protein
MISIHEDLFRLHDEPSVADIGLRDRWRDFAEQAREMERDEFVKACERQPDGSPSPFLDLLSKIEGAGHSRPRLHHHHRPLSPCPSQRQLGRFLAV